jgi:hypothetical protein
MLSREYSAIGAAAEVCWSGAAADGEASTTGGALVTRSKRSKDWIFIRERQIAGGAVLVAAYMAISGPLRVLS